MNVKIVFVIIGIILSMASFGEMCAQHIVCDTNGNVYPTPCAFNAAKLKDPTLEMGDCGIIN